MGDLICVKVCTLVQRSWPTSRWGTKLKFGRLIEGQPKPKKKSEPLENFATGDPKWGMENAMLILKKSGTDGKSSNIVYKEAL
jgi:hypothetical protein